MKIAKKDWVDRLIDPGWFVACIFLGGCVLGERAWDCGGAGFMQGCQRGQLVQRYYQSCNRHRVFHAPESGFRYLGELTVLPKKPDYDAIFEDSATCDWTRATSSEEVSQQQQAMMGFSPSTSLPDASSNIHHPVYGAYPDTVPFEQGMTLMPGQSATMTLDIPLETNP